MLLKDKGKQTENEKTSYNFFLQRGYSPEAASALTGNFVYESGLRTTAVGDKGYKGGDSEGIAQFREDRLKRLKSRYGDKWTDLNNQLEYVDWELKNTHKNAGQALQNAKTVHEAGQIVSDKYEIPAKKYKDNPDRRKAVESVYSKYSGLQVTTTTPVTPEVTNLPEEKETPKFTAEELEAQRILNERQQQVNALDELFSGQQEQIQNLYNQPAQQPQTLPQEDLNATYSQISNFVESPLFQEGGKIPVSPNGVHDYPKQKVIVPTNGSITMKNVNYPILGISRETGEQKLMMPGEDYIFDNTKSVVEFPLNQYFNK